MTVGQKLVLMSFDLYCEKKNASETVWAAAGLVKQGCLRLPPRLPLTTANTMLFIADRAQVWYRRWKRCHRNIASTVPVRAVPEVEGEAGTPTVSAGRNMLSSAWNVPGKKTRIEDTQHKTLNTSHNGTAWGPKTKLFLASCNQTLYFRCWWENQSIYWDL